MPHQAVPLSADMLREMEQKIAISRPQLQNIKERYGSLSYFDYVKQKTRVNINKTFSQRKQEIIDTIKGETTRLLGSAIASDIEKQLKRNDSVSTAEHTGPLSTGHMLNSGLHHAIPLFGNTDPRFRNILILSCSGTSFSNVLSFSRGFQFHSFTKDKVHESNVTFFGRSVDPETVMYKAPYTLDSIAEMTKKLDVLKKDTGLEPEVAEKIQFLFDTIYTTPHALSGADFSDQLTITNYYLWQQLFPTFRGNQIPNYVMLSQEKILLNLLLRYHLSADTPVHRFLFDESYHILMEKYFEGITGAFTKDRSSGTFLFWGISQKDHTRFQLFREGSQLVNKDRTFILPLTPDAVRQAIIDQTIFPSLLLTFTVLSFYYGLILGGGASQTSYLTQMKEGYIQMMREVGDEESAISTEQSITDDFVFYRPHLAFLEAQNNRIAATALDMYLYQDPSVWQKIIQTTKSVTIGEFLTVLLPVLYKQLCPDDEKDERLMHISRQDVETFLGLDTKIPPIAVINS